MPPVSLLFHDVFIRDPRESGFASPAADRYKLSAAAFDAQLTGLSGMPQTGTHPFLVTFDDGGASFFTIVADKLDARGIQAFCFVTTGCIGQRGFLTIAQLRELDARGHIIGTHSVSHPARFSALSRAEMRREWADSRRTLEDLLGHEVTSGSVPGGYFSREVALSAGESGLALLFNSEPVRSVHHLGRCAVAGRFTLRSGAAPDMSRRLVRPAPWARTREWASWNAKSLVKPLLGSSYPRMADWIQGGVR